jgi:redox-sensitive bicupin YhaK (pirin superfamily)
MIQIIEPEQRHYSDFGWLQTYWLFSFSSYFDADNVRHGPLRVFNDDVVQPGTGFSIHPHEEMEIVTIVLSGQMEHKDTMDNVMTIGADEVQRMTAGTGLQHSEMNEGDEPVKFFQIWIEPDTPGLEPSYDHKSFERDYWRNRFAPVASSKSEAGVVSLNTEASIYRASMDSETELDFSIGTGRKLFIYSIDGNFSINGKGLKPRGQARIEQEELLAVKAESAAELILIDVPG